MTYTVKARTNKGWKEIKRFDSPAEADRWLTNYIKANGYIGSDFTITAK